MHIAEIPRSECRKRTDKNNPIHGLKTACSLIFEQQPTILHRWSVKTLMDSIPASSFCSTYVLTTALGAAGSTVSSITSSCAKTSNQQLSYRTKVQCQCQPIVQVDHQGGLFGQFKLLKNVVPHVCFLPKYSPMRRDCDRNPLRLGCVVQTIWREVLCSAIGC